jgi:hypothetical protein
MKYSFILLALIVACSKPIGSSKKSPQVPNRITDTSPIEDIADPLVTPDQQQQQTDEDFNLNRTYNGANVVLNYNSSAHLGMIRVKGKDAEKLNKYMALNIIKVDAQVVKTELEAKVGKHIMCRPDACWIYIDYKNGDVRENGKLSEAAKAPRIFRTYKGENVELHMLGRRGRIFFEGMDAKALYSVMAVPELDAGGKGSISIKKSGSGVDCVKVPAQEADEKDAYKCEVKFNHRTGAMKDLQ